jgi:hypothetical protein
VGSGKSSVAAMKLFLMALEQPVTGTVKDSRWIVTRNTYGELKSTTIKTWLDWFPEGPGGINTMRWDAPITSVISFPLAAGVTFRMEVIFIALDKPDDLGKLRSIEATGAWMNEGGAPAEGSAGHAHAAYRALPVEEERAGSGESVRDHGHEPARRRSLVLPARRSRDAEGLALLQAAGWSEDHRARQRRQADSRHQQSAENVMNLHGGWDYYLNQAAGKDENWIKVFLCASTARRWPASRCTRSPRLVPRREEGTEADPRLPLRLAGTSGSRRFASSGR